MNQLQSGFHCTYILYSHLYRKIYIGSTGNLIQRFYAHNYLEKKGWTLAFRPCIVVFLAFHPTKTLALQKEKKLKQANYRLKIWQSLKDDFPIKGFIEM